MSAGVRFYGTEGRSRSLHGAARIAPFGNAWGRCQSCPYSGLPSWPLRPHRPTGLASTPQPAPVRPRPAWNPGRRSLRSGKALEDATRAALKQWARPTEQQAIPAARQLLRLYWELQHDKVLTASRRDGLRRRVGTRLLQLSQQIARNCGKDSRPAKPAPQPVDVRPNDKLLPQVNSVDVQPADKLLRQFAGGQQGFGGGGGGGAANGNWGDNIPDAGEDLVPAYPNRCCPRRAGRPTAATAPSTIGKCSGRSSYAPRRRCTGKSPTCSSN